MALVRVLDQRVHTGLRTDNDAAPASTISTAWAATRNVLFATKSHATAATSARNGLYLNAVDEHDKRSILLCRFGDSNIDATTFLVEVNVPLD